MAVELDHFLTDQLARLPADHPDRPFVEALAHTVAAFVTRTDAGTTTPLWPTFDTTPDMAPPDDPTAADAPTASATVEQERQRVILRGRLGKRVRFSTTPRGVARAEFNLATHHLDDASGDELTTWHTVLAFRGVADTLAQAHPQQGQYVEVIGYRQTEQRRTRDGQPKAVERVIAAKIRLQ